jgi:hypothetical protein
MLEKNHSIDLISRRSAVEQILALVKTSREGQVHVLGDENGTRMAIGTILSSINIDDKSLPEALIKVVNEWPKN